VVEAGLDGKVRMIGSALKILAASNLFCAGTETAGTINRRGIPSNPEAWPFAHSYRIDLKRRLWCSEDCTATFPLAAVTARRITNRAEHNAKDQARSFTRVERRTGKYVERIQLGEHLLLRTGVCSSAPFSGFPKKG
jgi:hypothetical protein